MPSVLITGEKGQLAASLIARTQRFATAGFTIHAIGRPDLDFDRPDTIRTAFDRIAPALVINAAAWTAVDLAETEPEAAMRANRDGPALLAALAAQAGVPLIHISTDYVFDGKTHTPYRETDTTNPIGVYGRTKLDGEAAVIAAGGRAIILRTAWVYSAFGKNFARSIVKAAKIRDRLSVVADQIGCPTEAGDLADAIIAIAQIVSQDWRPDYGGIFHAAGTEATSWHGFASAIVEQAAQSGWPRPPVDPITTDQWPTPVARPADSRLDCGKLAQTYGLKLPSFRESLTRIVPALLAQEE